MNGIKRIFINGRFLTQAITGVQRYAHELVKALDLLIDEGEIDRSRYRFELLAPSKGILYDLGLKHIPLRKTGYLSGHAWEQLELPFHSQGGLLFCPGNTAPVLSLSFRQATVITVHSLSFLYFPEAYSFAFRAFYRFIIPLVFRWGDAVITVSQSEKELIYKTYGQKINNLYAIQNGGVSQEFSQIIEKITPSAKPAHPFVLFVGSLSKGKNLQGVLEAITILNKTAHVSLVVVGAGGKTFNSTQVGISEELINKIDFKGQINDVSQLVGLYNSACCLVFPSFYEASSLPPIEAMACGCPVIASAIPALMERCGDAALYCDPGNAVDISEKIRQLIEDGHLRGTLRQKGLEQAQKFTWEKSAQQTFAVIRGILT
ncbi:MAG: glycosyltransferase family 4 protein [Thermincolia bacterium]